ncbi:hypothetical protein TWF718_002027 [Orbilia javanica]|uniref:Uncharacterized protein n=1 Tax=Orbilia javanica TaxID=47235 RepID=A0AAN8RNV6_9PEZI
MEGPIDIDPPSVAMDVDAGSKDDLAKGDTSTDESIHPMPEAATIQESGPSQGAHSKDGSLMPPPPPPKTLPQLNRPIDKPSPKVLRTTSSKNTEKPGRPMTIREWRAAARLKEAAEGAVKENRPPQKLPELMSEPSPTPIPPPPLRSRGVQNSSQIKKNQSSQGIQGTREQKSNQSNSSGRNEPTKSSSNPSGKGSMDPSPLVLTPEEREIILKRRRPEEGTKAGGRDGSTQALGNQSGDGGVVRDADSDMSGIRVVRPSPGIFMVPLITKKNTNTPKATQGVSQPNLGTRMGMPYGGLPGQYGGSTQMGPNGTFLFSGTSQESMGQTAHGAQFNFNPPTKSSDPSNPFFADPTVTGGPTGEQQSSTELVMDIDADNSHSQDVVMNSPSLVSKNQVPAPMPTELRDTPPSHQIPTVSNSKGFQSTALPDQFFHDDYIGDVPPELEEFRPQRMYIPWTTYTRDCLRDLKIRTARRSPLEAQIPFPEQWEDRRWANGGARAVRGNFTRGRGGVGLNLRGAPVSRGGRGRGNPRMGPSGVGGPAGRGMGRGVPVMDMGMGANTTVSMPVRGGYVQGFSPGGNVIKGIIAENGTRDPNTLPNKSNPHHSTNIDIQPLHQGPYRPKLTPHSVIKSTIDPKSIPLPAPTEEERRIMTTPDDSDSPPGDSDGDEGNDFAMDVDEEDGKQGENKKTNISYNQKISNDEEEGAEGRIYDDGDYDDDDDDDDDDSDGDDYGDDGGYDDDDSDDGYDENSDDEDEYGPETFDDDEQSSSYESSSDDEDTSKPKKKPLTARDIAAFHMFFKDNDRYWEEFGLEPEFEKQMLEHVRPFWEEEERRSEAQAALEEAKKKKIAELSQPPKFIGPAPQLQVNGQNKRVSFLDVNGGKPHESTLPPTPVKQGPKRVSFLTLNKSGSASPGNPNEKNTPEKLPAVTKSPLAGFVMPVEPQVKKTVGGQKRVSLRVAMKPVTTAVTSPAAAPQQLAPLPVIEEGGASSAVSEAQKQQQDESERTELPSTQNTSQCPSIALEQTPSSAQPSPVASEI